MEVGVGEVWYSLMREMGEGRQKSADYYKNLKSSFTLGKCDTSSLLWGALKGTQLGGICGVNITNVAAMGLLTGYTKLK